ncbi:MAG: alanine racemase [Lachnoclostridium sp.]
MKKYNRVCARIDLDAIEYNMEMMKKNIRGGACMIAVVKTDAYGHGAVQIARLFESKDYIWGYAVATAG